MNCIIRVKKILPNADASIRCAAQMTEIDMFVTWNTKDFMKPGIKQLVTFPVVVPSKALQIFRDYIQQFLD